MSESLSLEGEITHDLPKPLKMKIGEIILLYSRLEHDLTGLSHILLQLNKAESRIALKTPRAVDRLEIALDLLAIKKLTPTTDAVALRTLIERCSTLRDQVAHGIFLKAPETNDIYLRLTRGSWPKQMTPAAKIKRFILPQSILYGEDEANEAIAAITEARKIIQQLGAEIDNALVSFPDRFRPPAPNLNPHGHRLPTKSQVRRESSRSKA